MNHPKGVCFAVMAALLYSILLVTQEYTKEINILTRNIERGP